MISQQQETVIMSSQGVAPVSQALPDIIDIDTKYLSMTAKEFRDHSVKDFLSRPIVVSSPSSLWSTADPQGFQLATYNFPDQLILNEMYQEKLKGFVGLRATLNIRVQVNSQPFQAGRLMLQYIPYAQYMVDRVATINGTLQGRSGCPRVDLDLSVGTEVTMEIPYVSPHAFYNLVTAQGTFGSIYLVVYSPLQDLTGIASVEYTVWAWLTNVEIEYPTGAPINTTFGPQIAEVERASAHMELVQLANNKSPSGGVGKIASGLQDLSRIPIVGNIFTKPAWISAQAANILKLLGFSKPTAQGMLCESKLRGQARMANFNGMDMSHKLALSCDNEVETQPGLAGTSIDEMALTHVTSIPNYWATFTWPTSLSVGTIYQDLITPTKIKAVSTSITDRYVTTHMGYVANTFGLWRGSLVYTFKFVKTQFHSGRLMISFFPFAYNTDGTTSNGDVNKCYRMIVDLRDSTEVSFTVPYVSSRPWMNTTKLDATILDTGAKYKYTAATGVIQVDILNQLKATNTVVGDIEVLVEVAGGPDLKFANPTCPNYVPYSGALTVDDSFEIIDKAMAHMFLGTNESIQRNEAQLGQFPASIDSRTIESNWSPEALCIGEKILSIRQLVKRFGFVGSATYNDATNNAAIIAPFLVVPPQSSVTDKQAVTQFEYWYSLYAFWRGSMRWKAMGASAPSESGPITFSTQPVSVKQFAALGDSMNSLLLATLTSTSPITTFNTSAYGDVANSLPSETIIFPNVEGMMEFEVPYYNVSHITPAVYGSAPSSITNTNFFLGNAPPQLVVFQGLSPPSTTNLQQFNFFRAPGDDFSFFYLLGVPPLVNFQRP
nr:MAG: structural polyprotein [Dicistroviridae sp.]